MFSLLARRAILGVARAPAPKHFLTTVIRSPILANRSFTTSQRVLLAEVKPAPSVKTKTASKTSKKTAVGKTATKKPTKKTTKKTVVKAKKATLKRKVSPRPKSALRSFKPPPRKLTAYSVFVREKTRGMKEQPTSYAHRIAAEWKLLPESEKEGLVQRARIERAELVKKFDDYMQASDPALIRQYNRERRKMGKHAVHYKKKSDQKQPLRPFFKFIRDMRTKPEYKSWGVLDVSREAGRQWRGLTEADKSRYSL